ncbi:CYFA0S14e01948g1_1 [Cyberlindnera fabianii]|nr:CYFA0S14e01948g1_1 [Cyberlindnera fabianii]
MENKFYAALFYLNPVTTPDEIDQHLTRMHEDITRRLRPWIEHYVWDSSPITVEKVNHENYTYIYLELNMGITDTDEWLITSILWDMSAIYEDLYIRTFDCEGDHTLIEAWEALPDWLEPSVARHRTWINHQRIIIIPDLFYKDRGLHLDEALTFLTRASYKCLRVLEIENTMTRKCEEQPSKALQGQMWIECLVSRQIAGSVMENPSAINHAINESLKEAAYISGTEALKKPQNQAIEDPVLLKFRTRVETYLMMKLLWEKTAPKVTFDNFKGAFVDHAIKDWIKSNDIEISSTPLDKDVETFNTRGDLLQTELVRLMRIEAPVEPVLVNETPTEEEIAKDEEQASGSATVQEKEMKDMMSKLEQLFKDGEAGLDGIENVDGDSEQTSKGVEPQFWDDESENEEEDDDDDNDEEQQIRDYFNKEKIDIDEDDFFEFFGKEVLGLPEEQLEALRSEFSQNVKKNGETKTSHTAENYESSDNEYEEDETFDFSKDDAVEELQESLKHLMESLALGQDGPASTLFKNMK